MLPPPGRNSATGFTLLELLVVLAIAGLLVALVPPLYSKAMPGPKLTTTALDLALALRLARSQAIGSSDRIELKLFAEPPSYAIGNTSPFNLPEGISVTAYDYFSAAALPGSSVAKRLITEDEIVIHFYPDGSSNGAIVAVNNGTVAYQIDVSWLTGTVTMSGAAAYGH